MPKSDDGHVKLEAGQILDPNSFPMPTELVCVQVPKVYDQVALRECRTRNLTLLCTSAQTLPTLTYEGASGFRISETKVLSRTDVPTKPGFSKLKLSVKVDYTINYSADDKHMTLDDTASFLLTVNEIYCPECLAQGVVVGVDGSPSMYETGSFTKVESIVEAFHDVIMVTAEGGVHTFEMSLDIGAFFIIRSEGIVQLLIPAYGYCPVPPEQQNLATQTRDVFGDKCLTPFPSSFFPQHKWNPLDKKKDDWDD